MGNLLNLGAVWVSISCDWWWWWSDWEELLMFSEEVEEDTFSVNLTLLCSVFAPSCDTALMLF